MLITFFHSEASGKSRVATKLKYSKVGGRFCSPFFIFFWSMFKQWDNSWAERSSLFFPWNSSSRSTESHCLEKEPPVQNFYRVLAQIAEISLRSRQARSRRDVCKILNLGEIMARYSPSCWDCRDLAMMFVRYLGEITARYPPSHRDLTMMFVNFWISARFPPSRWDCQDLAMISSSSRWDFLHLAEIEEISKWGSTLSVSEIFPRFWKTQTSYREANILPRSRQNCQ